MNMMRNGQVRCLTHGDVPARGVKKSESAVTSSLIPADFQSCNTLMEGWRQFKLGQKKYHA